MLHAYVYTRLNVGGLHDGDAYGIFVENVSIGMFSNTVINDGDGRLIIIHDEESNGDDPAEYMVISWFVGIIPLGDKLEIKEIIELFQSFMF